MPNPRPETRPSQLDHETGVGLIGQHLVKLGTIGIQPDGSITRLAYSDEESAAMAYVRAEGEAVGLVGTYDGVGNLILSTPGDTGDRVLVGSHLDSVPRGGNFDGSAGIVAGLEALRTLLPDASTSWSRGVDLVVWRGEEYTFNAVYKGSAAAFGLAEPHILHNVYDGVSLRDAIRAQGFDPSFIDEARPTIAPAQRERLAAYLELHIEQGAVLEQTGTDVGLVTSIAGDRRFLVVFEGRFDHSGATPMGSRFRSDVNLAMSHVQVRLDELGRRFADEGHLFTQTVGIVNADPEIDRRYPRVHDNSVTKVSGLGYFTLDLMSADNRFLDDYAAEVHRLIWRTAREQHVKAFIEQTDASAGVPALDAALMARLRASCEALGVSHRELPSGAGHDAVMAAQAGLPTAMLFVPCRGGVSHDKEEYVSPEQVARGALVLTETLRRLVADPESRGSG